MTKQEFLDTLRRALNRELDAAEVEDNLLYYEDYISRQVAEGKTEEEVTAMLGDPRLIAKTILQVDERREGRRRGRYEDAQQSSFGGENSQKESEAYSGRGTGDFRKGSRNLYANLKNHVPPDTFKVKRWVAIAAGAVLVVAVLGAVLALAWRLLPLAAVVAAAVWIYHHFLR